MASEPARAAAVLLTGTERAELGERLLTTYRYPDPVEPLAARFGLQPGEAFDLFYEALERRVDARAAAGESVSHRDLPLPPPLPCAGSVSELVIEGRG